MEENPILVLDNGGCTIKAGLAGEDLPAVVVPNAVGLEDFVNLSDQDQFAKFREAYSRGGDLKVKRPMSNGSINNWDDMEMIWSKVIHEHLHLDPQETSILITEPIANPRSAREKMAEILIEKLNFSAISIATAPILPMYAAGRTTGIVLDVGDGVTQIVPVWGGYPMTDAMKRVDFGGRDITQLLSKEQSNRQGLHHANIKTPFEVFRLMKEKTCHVVLDYERSKEEHPSSNDFELPSGEKVHVENEAFTCPELLFSPSQFEHSDTITAGVHQLLYQAIMKTNIDVRKDLYANIVLSGGSTNIPGFVDRLEKELKELAPPSVRINIVAQPGRKYYTWIGGSIMASLTSFPSSLISKGSWYDGSGRAAIGRLYS